ncbi:thioredoxin peroxidase [Mycotypha africana]|uniref:thioredoxin peroxidase n=1 Tax=Mycotypha africana TaxID=64632 RepID=UPI002300DFA3|nr:thioredoxin peroxidase [Mycotypha africana]KAI8967630.1 thioredoxin peroxidase [Mycotypha africana]
MEVKQVSQPSTSSLGRRAAAEQAPTIAQVQKLAPSFDLPGVVDGEIVESIKLSDYKGKYVVLLWYPMDFTFVCPTEIIAFNDALDEFRALECEVIAASCDSEYVHHAWIDRARQQGGLGKETRLPIMADKPRQVAKEYGVYLDRAGIALRGLFIIDRRGILRQITINDLPVGRSVQETLRLVEAFQFTDQHGEVCPANWIRGEKTIIPDVEKAKAYFAQDDD